MPAETVTGGREATSAVQPGRYAISIGDPRTPLPEGWGWTRLTDVARLESGHTPSRRRPDYWDGGIPWIGIKDATINHGRVIEHTLQHASQLGIQNSSARVLPAQTVCLSRTASVGYVVVMGRPMATSQDFVNWVCSDELDWRYLKYVLTSETDALRRFAYGTTHQTIYFPEVKAFHVALPTLAEQRAIASVLGALGDKIESNRRTDEAIRAVTRGMFDSAVSVGAPHVELGDHVEFHNRQRVPLSAAQRREMPGTVPYHGATGVFDFIDRHLFDEILLLVGVGRIRRQGRRDAGDAVHLG